jgi:hypothetical protein
MPLLTPDQIRAVLALGEDVPTDTGYAPTDDDRRRARERAALALVLLRAIDATAPEAVAVQCAHDDPTPENFATARSGLKARADRSSQGIRWVRTVLIDGSRLLAGAADAVPV